MTWWRTRSLLADFITDTLHGELTKLRPGQTLPPRPWSETLEIGEAGLGADSLERLSLASALGQALRLDRSGLEDHLLARSSLGSWVDLAEVCLERFDSSMVFFTSGSAGQPKLCEHSLASLRQEVAFLAELFPGRKRVVAAVSCRHIYGFLFTVLLPEFLGIPVWRRLDKTTVTLGADLRPGDLVVGFPDFWRLGSRTVERLPPDVVAVSSTAPLTLDLDAILAERGLLRLVEIYGASETAGVGWRVAPSSEFTLFPFWTRGREDETLLRQLPDGETVEFSAQDRLHWRSDRRFRPAGRLDEAFQVGGVNVHPHRVVNVLICHPEVAEACVRLMRPEEGGRVKAFIVPRRMPIDECALAAELDRWAAEHLSAPERPKAYRFAAALPRDALGKLVDWRL